MVLPAHIAPYPPPPSRVQWLAPPFADAAGHLAAQHRHFHPPRRLPGMVLRRCRLTVLHRFNDDAKVCRGFGFPPVVLAVGLLSSGDRTATG